MVCNNCLCCKIKFDLVISYKMPSFEKSRMHLKLINTSLEKEIGNGVAENQSVIRILKSQGWSRVVWEVCTKSMQAWTRIPFLLWAARRLSRLWTWASAHPSYFLVILWSGTVCGEKPHRESSLGPGPRRQEALWLGWNTNPGGHWLPLPRVIQ